MEFLHSLINNINQQMLVVALLLISIGWFISQYAKNSIPRLIFIGIGTYIILTYPPLHFYTFIAIGFVLAHIFFLLRFLQVQYYIFKEASINSYYLMLTIYGKILSVFKWILSVFETIKILFQTKSFQGLKIAMRKIMSKSNIIIVIMDLKIVVLSQNKKMKNPIKSIAQSMNTKSHQNKKCQKMIF